jgi:hypothetical protein
MTVLGLFFLGLLAAASIVQTVLLVRAVMSDRAASRRMDALEGDVRLMMAQLPPHAAAAIEPGGAASADLPAIEPEVEIPREIRPRRRLPALGPGRDDEQPNPSHGPVRAVGGLNK